VIVKPKINDLVVNGNRTAKVTQVNPSIILKDIKSAWRVNIHYDTFGSLLRARLWILINNKKDIAKYLLQT